MSVSAISAYTKVRHTSEAESADPHRLIQMLIDGALEKMVVARSAMERRDIARRGEHISWAISIVGGLKASLDRDKGGELAGNLAALYDFITLRLVQANAESNIEKIEDAIQIMRTLKEGWDGIRGPALAMLSQQKDHVTEPA